MSYLRRNSSCKFRVLFLFLTRFHVNVARSNGNPRWRAFKFRASCCNLPQRQYFEDLFHENGRVFQKVCHCPLLAKQQKILIFSGVPRVSFCLCRRAHYTWAKKQIKLKSLRIDGKPRKRKRVVICQQLFPASSLRVIQRASENFPAKN